MRTSSMRSALRSAPATAVAALFLSVGFAAPATAADGGSTPGVTVTAVNPGTARAGSDLKLTLTAHTEPSTVTDPSCRPQDVNLECWGSLVLRIPAMGLTAGDFVVHRVAVGDISCGDDSGDEGGCGDEMTAATVATGGEPVSAQVNGLAVVKDPGTTGLRRGTQLQVKLTLTDFGSARYQDELSVQVNAFQPGQDKPSVWHTQSPQRVEQVQIHFVSQDG